MSYLCLFAHCGVQHILCCVFSVFFFVLCDLCCPFLWIVHYSLPLRYSLTFMYEHLMLPILETFHVARSKEYRPGQSNCRVTLILGYELCILLKILLLLLNVEQQ